MPKEKAMRNIWPEYMPQDGRASLAKTPDGHPQASRHSRGGTVVKMGKLK